MVGGGEKRGRCRRENGYVMHIFLNVGVDIRMSSLEDSFLKKEIVLAHILVDIEW